MNQNASDITAAKAMEIAGWITRQRQGILNDAERQLLNNWLHAHAENQELYNNLSDENSLLAVLRQLQSTGSEPSIRRVLDRIQTENELPVSVTRPTHFLPTNWFRYAAAIVIIAVGAYLWNHYASIKKDSLQGVEATATADIQPGGDKAILTLADGTVIVLDSTGNGQLAQQGQSSVIKKNGVIVYQAVAATTNLPGNTKSGINTMSTPKGGQYKLVLPDGTRVWLNAASSITYPTVFNGKERTVEITGELYFEVAKNTAQPFVVKTPREQIAVLGTHFNVNAYAEEELSRTTLLEGSIKVSKGEKAIILFPGEQAINTQTIQTNHHADIEQVMAWKNGFFNFTNADVHMVLRELSRWYDIEVIYDGKVKPRKFKGEMDRGLTLKQIIKILGKTGIKFKTEGRKMIVSE